MASHTQVAVLTTFWGTVLCAGRHSGHITHRNLSEILPEELLIYTGSSVYFADNTAGNGVIRELLDLVVVRPSGQPNIVHIKNESVFACAEANGELRFNREAAREWETFELISVAYVLKLQSYRFPQFRKSVTIPKSIHQTFPSHDLPAELRENVAQFRDMNCEYAYTLWSNDEIDDFIYDFYGRDILSIYKKINPNYGACRADLFRYLCIYKYGGVYLDIKSNSTTPLRDIIKPDDQLLLSQWERDAPDRNHYGQHSMLSHIKGGEYQQWHVIACAGHPLLEKVIYRVIGNILRYEPKRDGVGRSGVLRLSGPIAYSLAIHSSLPSNNYRLECIEKKGLIYSAVANHLNLFVKHYTDLAEPIVM